MYKNKLFFLSESNRYSFPPSSSSQTLPFTVLECGFLKERKIVFGKDNAFQEYLLLYSLSGTARYTKEAATTYIQPHSVVLSACNTPLSFVRVSKAWEFYYFILSGSHAKTFYNLVRTSSSIITNNPFTNVLESCGNLYHALEDYDRGAMEETHMQLYACSMLSNIFTSLYLLKDNVRQVKKLTPPKESDINTVIKYISDHYREDLTLDRVCDTIGFSKYHFGRIFKKHTGQTLHRYINHFRISKAKELLAYSKLSVHTIGSQVGFRTNLAFLRAFKDFTGMTPGEYRTYY